MKRIKLFYITGGMALIVLAILSSKSLLFSSGQINTEQLFAGRDFLRSPFELIDAYEVCQHSASNENSGSLLRSYMDDLSSTYNALEKTYLIVLNADIGDIKEFSEAKIYCSINAKSYEVSYYKEVYSEKKSFISRGASILASMLGD